MSKLGNCLTNSIALLLSGLRELAPNHSLQPPPSAARLSSVPLSRPLLRDVIDAYSVSEYRFASYFEDEVLRKRPYLKKEWCIRVLKQPIRSEPQENNRYRFWAEIPELEERFLRVVTLEDKVTIHNAFPDRRFKP